MAFFGVGVLILTWVLYSHLQEDLERSRDVIAASFSSVGLKLDIIHSWPLLGITGAITLLYGKNTQPKTVNFISSKRLNYTIKSLTKTYCAAQIVRSKKYYPKD